MEVKLSLQLLLLLLLLCGYYHQDTYYSAEYQGCNEKSLHVIVALVFLCPLDISVCFWTVNTNTRVKIKAWVSFRKETFNVCESSTFCHMLHDAQECAGVRASNKASLSACKGSVHY